LAKYREVWPNSAAQGIIQTTLETSLSRRVNDGAAFQNISPWHEPDRKERPMSAFIHHSTLLETFTKAVDAFNNQDFEALAGLLHPNAVLNRIHHRKHFDSLRGRVDVIKHLTNKLTADKTQFTPIDPISVGIRTGTVSGTGEWEDPQGAKPEKISYSFIFTQDGETKEWTLVNMDAAQQP
jgi:hypothetical protein